MKMRTVFLAGGASRISALMMTLFATLIPALGQRFDVTPLFGGRFGGTIELEQQGVPNFESTLANSVAYGVAAGLRIDGEDCNSCNLIEFRWMRQNTHLGLKQDPLVPTPFTVSTFRPAVTLDHFLGDFTHEWDLSEGGQIKTFVTGTLGAARMDTPAGSGVRFVFGFGTGVKLFPRRHWGIRFQVEYLPTVMHAELQRVTCIQGCVVALNGGVMNQFQVTVGPTFRF